MLNPAFPAEAESRTGTSYVLPDDLAQLVSYTNEQGASGAELRLQRVYGDELWTRLRSLGLRSSNLDHRDILDACCGTGFVSHHLLGRTQPRSLTLMDISPDEIRQAKLLLGERTPAGTAAAKTAGPTGQPKMAGTDGQAVRLSFEVGDLTSATIPDESFDVVIGNSFLHHFSNVPRVLERVHGLLRPGGLFIGLHEPTPAAVVWESGHVRPLLGFIRNGSRWIDRLRPRAGAVLAGSGDAWLFEIDDFAEMLERAGFANVLVRPRYLLRPLVVAMLGMHLTPERPRLSAWRSAVLRASIACDSGLARVAPARWFGGLCFSARRG